MHKRKMKCMDGASGKVAHTLESVCYIEVNRELQKRPFSCIGNYSARLIVFGH